MVWSAYQNSPITHLFHSYIHGLKRLPKFAHHPHFPLTLPLMWVWSLWVLCNAPPIPRWLCPHRLVGMPCPVWWLYFRVEQHLSPPLTLSPCTCIIVGAFVVFFALLCVCFSRFRAIFSPYRRSKAIFRIRPALLKIFSGFLRRLPSYLVQLP